MGKNTSESAPSPSNNRPVTFTFPHPTATAVCIAGTFNDWRPDATPLVADELGEWRVEVSLAPGRYEYLFVVDGAWVPDPLATEFVPNPFGGANAVITV